MTWCVSEYAQVVLNLRTRHLCIISPDKDVLGNAPYWERKHTLVPYNRGDSEQRDVTLASGVI